MATPSQTLTTAYVTYSRISEDPVLVPSATEHFAQGFRTDGAQDIDCAEMWAMILHVPSSVQPYPFKFIRSQAVKRAATW